MDIVQNIIEKKNYKKYLEIGCFDNELFNHINCQKKVGVDPDSGGTVRKTSDQFFLNNKECLPNNYYEQAIPRCQWTWNGDVWKAIVETRKSKDVDVYTCYADYGIGVIIKRPNRNLLNHIKKDSSSLNFDDYFNDYKNLMNIIEYENLMKII